MNHTLDVRRLLCPLPIIKLQKIVSQSNPGDIVLIRATDRGVFQDIPSWCKIEGHSVLKMEAIENEIQIEIQIRM